MEADSEKTTLSKISQFFKENDQMWLKLTHPAVLDFLKDIGNITDRHLSFWPCCGTPEIRCKNEQVKKSHPKEPKTLNSFKKNPEFDAINK
ncbi:hypothetical protein [uncultured Acinetobacter sp.]|jgi:hypothetical protein|uniref:hypothetical protein n=1 Tax=uncultured Acinetobacter sp. TaxID=165433 RepID=UPI002605EA95|nr:hypothetical protein [uncultured Acinetobacter sp.]